MKVAFNNGVSSYSGKMEEVVYQSWFNSRLCYGRKYVYPKLGLVHQKMKTVSLNLDKVYKGVQEHYLEDLKSYSEKNARENLPKAVKFLHKMPSSKSLFIHCMYEWQKSDPSHVSLDTITIEDIVLLDSPVRTILGCINSGYLKRVTGCSSYTHDIQTG